VIAFIDANEAWVEKVLSEGRRAGTIAVTGRAADAARLIVSGLEGAMLVSRPYGDIARFDTAAAGLLASFGAAAPALPATSGQDG
jgi:TetR/AcrR family transcriptional repressor of nem operon